MNRELPDVQAGFRKGRGTRDLIQLSANVLPPWSLFGLRDPALGSAGLYGKVNGDSKRAYAKRGPSQAAAARALSAG